MRTAIGILLLFLFTTLPTSAQTTLQGTWEGVLKLPPLALRIVVHVSGKNGALTATTDRPDQKAYGLPVETIAFKDQTLDFTQPELAASYKGKLSDGKISGTFTQHGFSLPLVLSREGTAAGRGIVGNWDGTLHFPPPPPLHVVLHVSRKNGSLSATTDSPDQGGYGMRVDSIVFTRRKLHFTLTRVKADYKGTLVNGKISGTFVQHGRSTPLTLSKISNNPEAPALEDVLSPASSRKTAPKFFLADSKGAKVNLSHYKGKVVLLDFWATWCGGCRTEIPWYEQFEHKFGADGFSAIGVAMDKSWKTVRPFMANEKMNYPVVVGSTSLLRQYGVFNLPATFLIDRDGRIAGRHIGVVNKNQFESEIKKLLMEKGS